MYAPRHRRFTTGLVHGEVKHFAQDKQSKIARAQVQVSRCAHAQ